MIARFLCWLSLHQIVVTHTGEVDRSTGLRDSALGSCTRCNKQFQWDIRERRD